MKTILAYGDSLTWGLDVARGQRHAYEDRWTSVLEAGLAGEARVVAEGLNGRTTAYDWPDTWDSKNGAALLPTLLEGHQPLDLVILALGGNDLVPWVDKSVEESAAGMRKLVGIVRDLPSQRGAAPLPILIVGVHTINPTVPLGDDAAMQRFLQKSRSLAAAYRELAAELATGFFEIGALVTTDPVDGIHLDASNTRKIGEALLPVVAGMLRHGRSA